MTATDAPALSELSEDQLASLYDSVSYDQEASAIILAELARRDRAERDQAARNAEREEWAMMAQAQYEAAERETCGQLIRHANRDRHSFDEGERAPRKINPDSDDAAEIKARRVLCARCGHPLRHPWHEGVSPFILWEGTEEWARKYGSEELNAFWDRSPRVTVTQWQQAQRDGRRMQRDERERDAQAQPNPTEGEPMEPTQAGAYVAPEATAPAQDRQARLNARVAELRAQGQQRAAQMNPHAAVAVRESATPVRVFPPIDGARLASHVKAYLTHHVAFPSNDAANVVVAWLLHAVARDRDDKGVGPLIWRATPRLLVTSRKRGSGKSTLLDLIVMLTKSRNGKIPKITPRAIAHVLGELQEAVVLDEAKTIFGAGQRSLELQGILLAGYTRRTNYVVNAGSKNKSLPLFGPVAYAGKDELITETNGQLGDLLDRSLVVRMRPPSRPMPEVDERAEDVGEALADLMAAWTDSVRGQLMQAARDLAAEDREAADTLDQDDPAAAASLRAAQISRPLRACGRVLGEEWEAAVTDGITALTTGSAAAELSGAMDDMERQLAQAGYLDEEPAGYMVTDDNYDYEEE